LIPRRWLTETPDGVASLVEADLAKLRSGNVMPTQGDIRCITFGHLIRLAIWSLRKGWDKNKKTETRLSTVDRWVQKFGGWPEVNKNLNKMNPKSTRKKQLVVAEDPLAYGEEYAEISF
jgi:hypothetical protein